MTGSGTPVSNDQHVCSSHSIQEEKKEWQRNASRRRRWKAVLISFFVLLFLAEVDLLVGQEKNQIVGAKAQELAAQLIDFAQARAERTQRKANESLAVYQQRIFRENAITESLYSERYYKEVVYLQQALTRRGLRDPALDEFYRRPGSAIGVREVGQRLFEMGGVLRSRTLF